MESMGTSNSLEFYGIVISLKEKLTCFDELPLLSARDIKEYLTFKLYKQMTEQEMLSKIKNRHKIRQRDINQYHSSS